LALRIEGAPARRCVIAQEAVIDKRQPRSEQFPHGLPSKEDVNASRETNSGLISHHKALIYTMVTVSAAGSEMTDEEIMVIGEEVWRLPIFHDYDINLLPSTAAARAQYLQAEER